MLIINSTLTPEERRALGIAALTAMVTGIVGGAVAWGLEEAKRFVTARRDRKPDEPMVTLQ